MPYASYRSQNLTFFLCWLYRLKFSKFKYPLKYSDKIVLFNYVILFSSAVMATWFVTDSGTFICRDPIQFISLSFYSPMVSWSSVKSGPRWRTHHQIVSLFAVQYLRWVCGAYTTKTTTYLDIPFESQTHQISYQIGLVDSSTDY